MEYITICNLVTDCDDKLLKGGLTNPVACGLRQQELRTDEWKSDREMVGMRCVLGEGMPVAVYVEVSLLYRLMLSYHPSTVLKPQGELGRKNSL